MNKSTSNQRQRVISDQRPRLTFRRLPVTCQLTGRLHIFGEGGVWHLKHSWSMKAVCREYWSPSLHSLLSLLSISKNLNQTDRSVSVTSGAGSPPPPLGAGRLFLSYILVHRGERIRQIPPSLPCYRRPTVFIGPLQWSESGHVMHWANGMWWEERGVWLSFNILGDLM